MKKTTTKTLDDKSLERVNGGAAYIKFDGLHDGPPTAADPGSTNWIEILS